MNKTETCLAERTTFKKEKKKKKKRSNKGKTTSNFVWDVEWVSKAVFINTSSVLKKVSNIL